jgi:uncharacterized membrane protein YgdD (TMEM256/DUF423 family)
MTRRWISIGAFSAALSVALGAFGAHGLKEYLAPESLRTFETAVQYQFYHSLGLIFVGVIVPAAKPPSTLVPVGWLMLAGILLFSGSLYLLSLTGIRGIGIVTPFGGVAFIVAWLLLAFGILRQSKR